MRRVLLLGLGIAVGAARVSAQEATDPHDAQPERPTVATHAYTVWPGWVEVEAGIETDRFDAGVHAFSTPVSLKLGLVPRVQLEISDAWMRTTSTGPAREGGGDLTVSVKWRIADSLPVLGSFAVLPALKLPTGSATDGLGTGSTDARITLISSHQLGPVELDINAGYTWRASTAHAPRTATLWTVSAGTPVRGILGWTAEVYGYPGTAGPLGTAPIVALLTGPVFTVRRWAELDTGVILPLDGPQAHAFYAGGTWNMGRIW
ncbi:MAG TPA: transporter [Gemmatimonadaceae bacterium]|nr:transporter [Gemmatimonadaceae bacterium]